MFAGSITGGIPGSGTDRSDRGSATGQVAAGCETGRAREAEAAAGCGVPAAPGLAVSAAGWKTRTTTATTTARVTPRPPSQTQCLVCGSDGQPTLPMPDPLCGRG